MKKFKVIICIILVIYAEHVATERFHPAEYKHADNFKFMLSMIRKTDRKHFCGATRLGEKWAITAAHCVFPLKPAEFYVVTTNNEKISIDEIFQNDLVTFNVVNDIALLKLKIDEARYYVTARLSTHSIYPIYKDYAVLVDKTVITHGLLFLIAPVATYEDCLSILSPRMPEGLNKLYCSRGSKNDTCSGDGAGAPVYLNENYSFVVVGVVSYGFGCDDYGYNRGYIYTEVYPNIKWIKEIMSK